MRVEITHVEDSIKQDIDAGLTQQEVAKTYALALRSSWPTNWRAVNRMIIDKWSPSGLERIKRMAHSGRCFNS